MRDVPPTTGPTRTTSYGVAGASFVDKLGVWLSARAIARWAPRDRPLRALDLGCGYRATHLCALLPRLSTGVGVDLQIDPACLAIPGLTFHQGSIEATLPVLDTGSFDLILLNSVLEHLAEPTAVLRACHGLLAPGGTLLVNVPTWRGKWFLEFSAFVLKTSPAGEMDDHRMYYDLRDLWPLLVAAGFTPSHRRLFTHKFGLNLFAVCGK